MRENDGICAHIFRAARQREQQLGKDNNGYNTTVVIEEESDEEPAPTVVIEEESDEEPAPLPTPQPTPAHSTGFGFDLALALRLHWWTAGAHQREDSVLGARHARAHLGPLAAGP